VNKLRQGFVNGGVNVFIKSKLIMALGLIVHDVFTADYFSHVDVHNSGIKKVKNIKKHTDLMTTMSLINLSNAMP
jgi:hypothetical protein